MYIFTIHIYKANMKETIEVLMPHIGNGTRQGEEENVDCMLQTCKRFEDVLIFLFILFLSSLKR